MILSRSQIEKLNRACGPLQACELGTYIDKYLLNLDKTSAQTIAGPLTFQGDLTLEAGEFLSGSPLKFTQTTIKGETSVAGSSYTLSAEESGIILVDMSTAGITAVLPTVSGNTGLRFIFKIISTTAGASLIVDGHGDETIEGSATKWADGQYETLDIVSSGSTWLILSSTGTWS